MDGFFHNLLPAVESVSYDDCDPANKATWENFTFPTPDSAIKFYKSYASSAGFVVRIQSCPKGKSKVPHYLHYVCNKQGYKAGSALNPNKKFTADEVQGPSNQKKRVKPEVRGGCLASIRFLLSRCGGYYKISNWSWELNHDLHPQLHSPYLNRELDPLHASLAEINAKARIPVRSSYELISRCYGGSNNLPFLSVDLKNHLAMKRQVELAQGEATSLLEYFRSESLKKPNYFYSVQVDSKEQIASIFWADGIMRSDYNCFGDVLCFDTTFNTNQLYRPLGAMIGFNQHREICIFGDALLFNETSDTFAWLFNTFFEYMSGKYPQSFLTDQCASIGSAVKKVMPRSMFHGLCSWHIGGNAKKHLGVYADSKFSDELHFLINEVDSLAEFDFNWEIMVKKCFEGKDEDHIKWLQYIKGFREQWSSAWLKDHFTAGLKSTQLIKSFNSVVKKYIKSSCSLSDFFERFNTMVGRLRQREFDANFNGIQFFPKNSFVHSALMQHASKVYTSTIFTMIHQEFECKHAYFFDHDISLDTGDDCKSFQVFQLQNPSDIHSRFDERIVTVDFKSTQISCTCRMFSNWGFFCRHIFKIMDSASSSGHHPNLMTIPEYYILPRRTRSAKARLEIFYNTDASKEVQHGSTYEEKYQRICVYTNLIATNVCMYDQPYEIFLKDLLEAGKKAIQSLGQQSQSVDSTSKAPLDCLAKGVKVASNRKNSRKRLKSLVEQRRWKKRARRKQIMAKAKSKEAMARNDSDHSVPDTDFWLDNSQSTPQV